MSRFLFAFYCDDIRQEVGNKPSFMGVYFGHMFLSSFPAMLPKICAFASVTTPIDQPFEQLSVSLFRDDELLARTTMTPEQLTGWTSMERPEVTHGGELKISYNTILMVPNFNILAPCALRIQAECETGIIRGPFLSIAHAPSSD